MFFESVYDLMHYCECVFDRDFTLIKKEVYNGQLMREFINYIPINDFNWEFGVELIPNPQKCFRTDLNDSEYVETLVGKYYVCVIVTTYQDVSCF